MSYFDPFPPGTNVQLPHKVAGKQEQTRRLIRVLLMDLPEEEASAHTDLINASEAAIDAKKAEDLEYTIVWDEVPGELKNIIYKFLFTQKAPIQPRITRPRSPTRQFRKFDLGANLLRCSKEIFNEAHPILLGDNVFELNNHLTAYLGPNAAARRAREPLVQKLICKGHLSAADKFSLTRFQNLTELTIIADTKAHFVEVGPSEDLWETRSTTNARGMLCDFLRQMIRTKPLITYHVIYEHYASRDHLRMAAYRWRVAYDRSGMPNLRLTLLGSNRYQRDASLRYPKV